MENLIENYPKEFASLFVFSGEITATDVIQTLYMGKDRTDPVSMELLKQYISSLSQPGIFISIHLTSYCCEIQQFLHSHMH